MQKTSMIIDIIEAEYYTRECMMSTGNGVDITKDTVDKVSLGELSEMSGVPLDYIKSELVLDGENVDMSELREKMLGMIDATFFKEA